MPEIQPKRIKTIISILLVVMGLFFGYRTYQCWFNNIIMTRHATIQVAPNDMAAKYRYVSINGLVILILILSAYYLWDPRSSQKLFK